MNVEELLKARNIEFRYRGNDLLVNCLNPEHPDKNPSMSIDKDSGIFRCLSCEFKGNIFAHFDVYKNITHQKALQMKKKINNLYYPVYHIPLGAIPYNRSYRNISGETYTRFEAFTHTDFPHRLVFPIYDSLNEIKVFHARLMHSQIKEKKYINSPAHVQMPLYPSYPDDLVNNSIILVEGLFDMINLYDKGLKNAVCMFGLGLATKDKNKQAENVKKFEVYRMQGVTKVYIMLDNDENEAGNKAASIINGYLGKHIMTEILYLPKNVDPGSLDQDFVDKIKEAI